MKIRVLNGTKNYTEKKKLSLLKIFFSRITTINRWLVEHGYDIAKLWSDIDDIIIKVLISAHSILKHNYRACFPNHYRGSACFEILGFDVLIDRKLKPYVLEVKF
jgi:tubulin polyglutamylase TTLL6/13